ncbi:MAG: RDD family protein [Atribacterota bacterium]
MQSQVYPWRRYWARLFDITFIMPFYIFIISLFSPGLNYTITRMENFIGGTLLLLFYLIFFEPTMLSSFGTTPGKVLLGIKIRALSGEKISYTTGMKRGFLVWIYGMGIGIPFIALFTMIIAYNKLKRNGVTGWDEKCGISVLHDQLSIFRVILFITLFIFCLFIWVGFVSNF